MQIFQCIFAGVPQGWINGPLILFYVQYYIILSYLIWVHLQSLYAFGYTCVHVRVCIWRGHTVKTYSPAGWLRERVDERVCTIGSRVALASKRVYLFISDTIKCQVIKEKSLPYQFLSSQSTTRYNKWQDILSLFLSLSFSLFGIFH